MDRLKVAVITFCAVILLNFTFGQFPELLRIVYTNGLFQIIRIFHDYTLGFVPVPSLYLILPAYLIIFFKGHLTSIQTFAKAILHCLLWTINLFYLMWGFNYQQPAPHALLKLENVEIDSNYIFQEFEEQTRLLHALVEKQVTATGLDTLENQIRRIQEPLVRNWGFSTLGRIRVRKMFGGFLLHFRTTGIYIPHAMEGHFDSGIYYKQYPFTLAHEMAHGYGFTDESVCNFIAYVTCIASNDNYTVYSAELAYWRYLSIYFRYFYEEEWERVRENLHPVIKNDLDEIKAHIIRYRDWMPKYRDIIYDRYLKSHGVKAGIRSYDQMILLIASYKSGINLQNQR